MRKTTLAAVVLGSFIGVFVFVGTLWTIQPTIAQAINNYRVLFQQTSGPTVDAEAKALTLLAAWDATQEYAHSWSNDSVLIMLTSADVDDQDQEPRVDGARRVWQAVYTSQSRNKELHLQIVDGAVTSAIEDAVYDPGILTIAEKPQIDSPAALKVVQEAIPDFNFSVGRGKGFHFGLHPGTDGKPVITVVGSSKASDGSLVPTGVKVDPTTGQILDRQELPK